MIEPPRQTYKALLQDYDWIMARSDNACRYCLTEKQVQMILAMVEYVGWRTRWISLIGTEIDQEEITELQGNLAEALMSGCCDDYPGRIYQFTQNGIYQGSDDNGATWFDVPDEDPRNSAPRLPPLTESDPDIARCMSSENITELFWQWREEMSGLLAGGSVVSVIIVTLLAFAGGILFISVVGAVWGVMIVGLAVALFQAGEAAFEAAVNETTQETFKCMVYCRAEENGQFTPSGISNLLADIATEFDGLAELWYYQQVAALGHVGLSNMSVMGQGTGASCDECPDCNDTFCYVFDFATAGDEDWDAQALGGSVFGTYVASNYWDTTDAVDTISNPDIGARGILIRRTHDTRTITKLTVVYDYTKGNVDIGSGAGFAIIIDGAVVQSVTLSALTNGTDITRTWTGTQANADYIEVFLRSSRDQSSPYTYGGVAHIKSITVEGIGSNPFGADNCDE